MTWAGWNVCNGCSKQPDSDIFHIGPTRSCLRLRSDFCKTDAPHRPSPQYYNCEHLWYTTQIQHWLSLLIDSLTQDPSINRSAVEENGSGLLWTWKQLVRPKVWLSILQAFNQPASGLRRWPSTESCCLPSLLDQPSRTLQAPARSVQTNSSVPRIAEQSAVPLIQDAKRIKVKARTLSIKWPLWVSLPEFRLWSSVGSVLVLTY